MSRIDKINELLRSELANLINQEININNGLITVTFVDCSKDLKHAKIGISVLPENLSGTALEKLRKESSHFCKILVKKLNIKNIPRFNWIIDDTEKNAAKIENILNQIKEGK
jgi:ribosome-binding factor A